MDFIINLFTNNPLVVVKIFVLLLELLYTTFAFVLYRQERLMATTVEVPVAGFFQVLSLSHFIGAVLLFILSVFIL